MSTVVGISADGLQHLPSALRTAACTDSNMMLELTDHQALHLARALERGLMPPARVAVACDMTENSPTVSDDRVKLERLTSFWTGIFLGLSFSGFVWLVVAVAQELEGLFGWPA